MTQKIAAFVAKSFDPADEAKIAPIEKFLESFRQLGFIPRAAEQSEVESVSEKVRGLIDESDVFVGIFTKRHPVYRFQGRWRTTMSALKGSLKPSTWSAPPWVLQESGYALRGNKTLVLFRETDVEIPGLQGDLEYIPYDPQNPATALQRASEMINGIVAKAANIRVETVVQSGPSGAEETTAALPPEPSGGEVKPDEGAPAGETFRARILDLFGAVVDRDWDAAQQKYDAGLKWVHEHEPESEISWKAWYFGALFRYGKTDALAQLRELAAKHEGEYAPLSQLGNCLLEFGEYDEAVKCFVRAASVAEPDVRASLEIRAAEVLQKAKKSNEAKESLLKLRLSDYAKQPKTQFQILQLIYSLSKESEDKFGSFAIAELALHQRPEEMSFRFSLAFDYEKANHNHLSLYHYKILCEHDEKQPSVLNNLAVACTKCDLLVLAARHYKRAYELGDTLAASNLSQKYLEAGLVDDAISLLKDAQAKENCVPEVSQTLATVYERVEENNRNQEEVLTGAEELRNFLLLFADGLLSLTPTNAEGRWQFPLAEIDLKLVAETLNGIKKIEPK
jgi:Flp pilus assembly protein TadD